MRLLSGLCGAVALAASIAPGARADEYNEHTSLTFSGPVQLLRGALPASLSQGQLPQEPGFRSPSTDLVVLPTTVVDERGQPVANLSKDHFAVYDEGRRQTIALFSSEDTPVSMALVIDTSGSMQAKLGDVVTAALALARSSNPDDELRVVQFNDSVGDVLGGRKLTAADTPELQAALHSLVPKGRTALYDALLDALNHLEQSRLPRKVIVLVSDGADNASVSTFDQVLKRARRSNVTIYAIGIFDPRDPDADDQTLRRIAHETGGERFHPLSPALLIQACEHIARQIRAGYTIGYIPPDRDGRFHRVRVDVDAPRRLVVRTRPGYFAASASTP